MTCACGRGVLNRLLPDVYLFSDHNKGPEAGLSPGFALSLTAESTSGCVVSTESAARPRETPEELGVRVANSLLEEVARGGCYDTDVVPLVLVWMAMTPEDVSRIRIGKLSPRAVGTLRLLRQFFGITFRLRAEPKGTLRTLSTSAPLAPAAVSSSTDDSTSGAGGRAGKSSRSGKRGRDKDDDFERAVSGGGGGLDGDEDAADDDDDDDPEAAARRAAEAAALARRVEVAMTDTVLISCVGTGMRNFARIVS